MGPCLTVSLMWAWRKPGPCHIKLEDTKMTKVSEAMKFLSDQLDTKFFGDKKRCLAFMFNDENTVVIDLYKVKDNCLAESPLGTYEVNLKTGDFKLRNVKKAEQQNNFGVFEREILPWEDLHSIFAASTVTAIIGPKQNPFCKRTKKILMRVKNKVFSFNIKDGRIEEADSMS